MLRSLTLVSAYLPMSQALAHIGHHESIGWWHWLTEPATAVIGFAVAAFLIVKSRVVINSLFK